ncbi:SAM hydrolase/SAM-dependent halogenase family protein [Rubrobacter calidifluminis]|uniref:SAM hydrolase/SAM-dependent halogenase family protein n=1 Tax=Rubrobacter calidifluminis TaxID=1392640 RepID=UPI0023624887|nr:SAM-dependent chlorinase/fluorinase [Rubrobacter calidifluminis]
MRPICFLSDFGLADDFVGSCKGVIASIAPEAHIIDLTHDVPGFEIEAGAEILQHATRYMPPDTVYLAVIDPGVGTERRGIALSTGSGALMVGPDNGLLLPAARFLGGVRECVVLNNPRYRLHPLSNTFHGRDIFSPAAAHLASGISLTELGDSIPPAELVDLELPETGAQDIKDGFEARIISIDRFGNARLSVLQEEADFGYGSLLGVDVGDGEMKVRYVNTFGAAKPGELVLVPDSHWRLSLCINRGNAAQALSLSSGERVHVRLLERQDAGGG